MTFDELLRHVGRTLGKEDLPREADGGCRLRFADGISVRLFTQGRNQLYIEGELAELPRQPGEAEQVLRQTLGRAFARLRTRDQTIALDEAGRSVVMFVRMDLDGLAPRDFEPILAEFLDQIETWKAPATAPRGMMPSPMTMIFP